MLSVFQLVNNVVDAPYTDDVPETTLSDQRKRAMSHSRFRNRTLSQAERAVENEYVTVEPRKRSATQEGYYNMKLVVDDVSTVVPSSTEDSLNFTSI